MHTPSFTGESGLQSRQLLENVLNAHRGDRIDGDRELVEQHLRQRAGDRQVLLLTTRSRRPK
ncbi:MAG: hypothetical protein NOF05_15875 [Candidatus Accumulibacter phosphatis]|uniref:Uncharacterized protein n=1 Tax=Candidatus Accumulibacter cognatus TaxID=2954383 RepID=A0A7D5NDI0_9PROT|nr:MULTISPECIES: hypothetical protein [Candidatus Accumulibacter]MBL8399464.1 hypothetical protein [Accumulibacter sp.]MBN8520211.1 hypothetical protein [Accumulibacter sp.]MBO3711457.1 hypothetical protein [Accumulibacter sp.]MCC2868953.1 hypothetical protein [Candidatus Accumulibacter phosphatis]MCM8579854.1 hypothetical protein [Accumulibacter sp.]